MWRRIKHRLFTTERKSVCMASCLDYYTVYCWSDHGTQTDLTPRYFYLLNKPRWTQMQGNTTTSGRKKTRKVWKKHEEQRRANKTHARQVWRESRLVMSARKQEGSRAKVTTKTHKTQRWKKTNMTIPWNSLRIRGYWLAPVAIALIDCTVKPSYSSGSKANITWNRIWIAYLGYQLLASERRHYWWLFVRKHLDC